MSEYLESVKDMYEITKGIDGVYFHKEFVVVCCGGVNMRMPRDVYNKIMASSDMRDKYTF